MSLLYAAVGFVAGFFVGIGAALFYLRWKMSRQLGMMQDQMEDMMGMTGDMGEAFDDIEVEPEEVEKDIEKGGEEKED